MKKTVSDRIVNMLSEASLGIYANDVRLGLRYVAIELDNGICGLAYRFPAKNGCDEMFVPADGPLIDREAGELLSWLRSKNLLQRSIGLATASALIASIDREIIQGDIRSVIDFRSGENVAMIGHFEPLVADIREQCSLSIFELDTSSAQGLEPAAKAIEGLRNSDIALITSTAIINDTLDELLEATTGCREVVILGPSTPLLPKAFKGTPVTLLSGIKVQNNTALLRIVSEGGGMRLFKQCVQKVNIRLPFIQKELWKEALWLSQL